MTKAKSPTIDQIWRGWAPGLFRRASLPTEDDGIPFPLSSLKAPPPVPILRPFMALKAHETIFPLPRRRSHAQSLPIAARVMDSTRKKHAAARMT